MIAPNDFKEKIKVKSRQLGFALAGVTTPDPPPHSATFENWLAQNQHGTMGYLATERSRSAAQTHAKFFLNVNPFLFLQRLTIPLSL